MSDTERDWRDHPDRIEICVDCVLLAANGTDDRYSESDETATRRYLEAVSRNLAEPVHLSGPNGEADETAFSRASCDFCGATDAGARYGAVLSPTPTATRKDHL